MNPRVAQPNDPAYLRAALSAVGFSEAHNNPKVLAMYAACGHREIHSTSVAWCAAFVGWALVQGGLPTSKPVSDNLLAASYVNYPGRKFTKNDTIPRGAICVWPRAEGSGHVNICLADLGDRLLCVGGNQSNGEGGGVTIVSYPKSPLRVAVLPLVAAQPDVEPVPLPPIKPPVQDTEVADPQSVPQPKSPVQDDDAPISPSVPWWHPRRAWHWITGGGLGLGGFAFDPAGMAKLLIVVLCGAVLLVLIAFGTALMLFGRARVADYIRTWLPRKDA